MWATILGLGTKLIDAIVGYLSTPSGPAPEPVDPVAQRAGTQAGSAAYVAGRQAGKAPRG